MSRLFVVATPIGNLGDMSPRALRLLREAALILAEDTRVTRKLLTAFDIHTPLLSSHAHNEEAVGEDVVTRMLTDNIDVALVTDAGTPGISDPGSRVVRQAAQAGIQVIPVPGPSAMAAALSVSGFDEPEFTFFGFLPREGKELRRKLKSMAGAIRLAVMYESPHRVTELLDAIAAVFPDAPLSLSREITKVHEQTLRGTAGAVKALLLADEKQLRGEFCLVLNLSGTVAPAAQPDEAIPLESRLLQSLLSGKTLRDAQDELIRMGERRNAVYTAALSFRKAAQRLLSAEDDAGQDRI